MRAWPCYFCMIYGGMAYGTEPAFTDETRAGSGTGTDHLCGSLQGHSPLLWTENPNAVRGIKDILLANIKVLSILSSLEFVEELTALIILFSKLLILILHLFIFFLAIVKNLSHVQNSEIFFILNKGYI